MQEVGICQRCPVFTELLLKSTYIGKEHNPPHVHFIYGDRMGSYDLRTLTLLEGDLPAKADALSREWLGLHKDELLEMWNTQVFKKLPPLE